MSRIQYRGREKGGGREGERGEGGREKGGGREGERGKGGREDGGM